MPPSKEACQVYADINSAKAKILKQYLDIKELINKILSTKIKLKFGIVDLADVIGAEVLSAVETLAASVAKAALGAISQAASSVIEAILKELLKILLAFPTAIFSLVSIPLSQARMYNEKERLYLSRANGNMRVILGIVMKWTAGASGEQYYQRIVNSMPYIKKSISLIQDIIKELQGEAITTGGKRNSVFDDAKYNSLQANLNRAIKESMPVSVINNNSQLTANIERDRSSIYKKLSDPINKEYGKRRKAAAAKYIKGVTNASVKQDINHAIDQENFKQQYSVDLNYIELWKKEELAKAQMEATYQSATNGSTYVKSFYGLSDQFSYDVKLLTDNLSQFSSNMVNAYSNYKLSQIMTNNVYNIRGLIRNVINEIISLLRDVSNKAGDSVITSLNISRAMIEVVYDNFTDASDKFVAPDKSISAIELSQTLFVGNQTLMAADAVMDSTITESLRKLINSDDVLQSSNNEFNDFINNISLIPDWNGEPGIWAVDIFKLTPSPYIQVIADCANLIVSVPALSISNSKEDQQTVRKLLVKVNKSFNVLSKHNRIVYSTLYSYEPYVGSEVGNLMKILSAAGMLQNFASVMSVATLIAVIGADVATRGFGTVFPSESACRLSYPEIFKDPDASLASVYKSLNIPSAEFNKEYMQNVEKNALNINKCRNDVKNYSVYAGIDPLKDLINTNSTK